VFESCGRDDSVGWVAGKRTGKSGGAYRDRGKERLHADALEGEGLVDPDLHVAVESQAPVADQHGHLPNANRRDEYHVGFFTY